jgi:hypothetical protein
MRARQPDREGFADLDGARVFFEVFGPHAVAWNGTMPTRHPFGRPPATDAGLGPI